MSWQQARDYCQAEGGRLAHPSDRQQSESGWGVAGAGGVGGSGVGGGGGGGVGVVVVGGGGGCTSVNILSKSGSIDGDRGKSLLAFCWVVM